MPDSRAAVGADAREESSVTHFAVEVVGIDSGVVPNYKLYADLRIQ